jgi:hypothetical protein
VNPDITENLLRMLMRKKEMRRRVYRYPVVDLQPLLFFGDHYEKGRCMVCRAANSMF